MNKGIKNREFISKSPIKLKNTLYPSKGNRRRFMNIYFENIQKVYIFAPKLRRPMMNQRLQLHNTAYFLAEIPNFCKSCCVHVHWFSGFV